MPKRRNQHLWQQAQRVANEANIRVLNSSDEALLGRIALAVYDVLEKHSCSASRPRKN